MTTRTKKKSPQADPLPVPKTASEPEGRAIARTILRPSVQAAVTLKNIAVHRKQMPLADLIDELSAQCATAIAGDLGRGEAMLMAQAHTLDAIFNRLIVRAAMNQGEYLTAAETYYRLALKAQSQCRATIESLALIKNPPNVAIVKQANIGQAVQVNNGTTAQPSSRARETEKTQNKLLEQSNGERLDVGASARTIATNSAMETLGALDRTEDDRR